MYKTPLSTGPCSPFVHTPFAYRGVPPPFVITPFEHWGPCALITPCSAVYLPHTKGFEERGAKDKTAKLQTALERQDLSCIYLAHHELESIIVIVIIIIKTFPLLQLRRHPTPWLWTASCLRG